ncbi:MAG: methionyl-tRNA formyltransferase [Spirochaetes bacterium]|nr:MAG: methionyl-tRNA formyltransferase [Spirochaetota bacterium]RKX87717.1 MAG: methionyl-tRNA formyltransferase [Spirochaetota bacterium]
MKILFAGTPEIAVPSLQALSAEFNVAAVLTAPDKVSGRGRKITPPAVKKAAIDLGIPVLQPATLGSDARKQITEIGADFLIVFAYGRIFGPKFMALFPRGGINMHPSVLPLHRGPSPITAAILSGADKTALTVQRVVLETDAGDIIRQTPYPLDGRETTASLTEAIAQAAAPELVQAVIDIIGGREKRVPQDGSKATYCRIICKEDGLVDWEMSAGQLEKMVRAYIPWPKCRTTLKSESLVILESSVHQETAGKPDEHAAPGTILGVDKSRGILIQTGNGILAVTRLQLASRKPLDFRSFLNGVKLENGTILGEQS